MTAASTGRSLVARGAKFLAAIAEGKSFIASGIQFLGIGGTGRMIWMTGGSDPNAEELTVRTAALTSIYASVAIDWRAARLGEAPLYVGREDAEGKLEAVKTHRLNRVLSFPRPDMSMSEILTLTQKYWDTTGAALWYLQRNQLGEPLRVLPLSRYEFKVKAADGLIFGAYEVFINNQWVAVKREDVVHFRDLNGQSWYEPTSRLEIALQWLNLGHSVTKMLSRYMLKAMFPGGVISPDPDWNPLPQDWEDYKNAISSWHGGPANAGKPLVVKGGTQFSKAALGMQDLVPAEVLDRVEANVGSNFGIPPIVLGWVVGLRNSPWSQAEQMERQAYQGTGMDLWNRASRAMTQAMLTPDEIADGFRIVFDLSDIRQLKPDEERNARIAAVNSSIWTLDEAREFTGQEPFPDAEKGATLVAELSMRAALGAGLGDPNGFGEDEQEETDEEIDEDEEATEEEKRSRKLARRRAKLMKSWKRRERKAVWAEFDTATKAAEPQWESSIYALLVDQRAQTMQLARETLEAKDINRDSADDFQLRFEKLMKESRPRIKAVAQPLLISTGGKAVRSMAARIDVTFDLLQPGLMSYSAREAEFLARVMGETTGRDVLAAVQKGLEEGDTINRMVDRLGELPAFDRARAKLVARTETTRAWNGAQRESLSRYEKDSGRKAFKTWLSSQDDRVRPEHQELDGEQQPIDEKFSNGLMEPGEPNCRCTLTYSIADPIGAD